MDLAAVFSVENLVALLTLALLEIVLGIDNLVFIAILTGRLPEEQQKLARQLGLAAALGTRLLLLFSLTWISRLTTPLFEIDFIHVHGAPLEVTGRSLILAAGGLFLIWKSTKEVHQLLEGEEGGESRAVQATFSAIIAQLTAIQYFGSGLPGARAAAFSAYSRDWSKNSAFFFSSLAYCPFLNTASESFHNASAFCG